ncbi:MAG: serine/threonine protein kinase, partial [Lentisphaeraceae bacterium]|nr:serine/threonine protein kinase [Lentisphaeraceae bacterium]
MSDEKFHIEPGMVISHFRLEKMLGEGGMGVVYLAEDITLNRKVAIKFMHKSMLASLPTQELREQVEQRFIREAKSVAGISHTNIAQVYEANFSSDNWYIVMEFIKGRPLDEILKEEGAFSIKDALRILEQTAKGLKYAWDNCKVVHRDIKPQNLMLTFDNYVKIVDLGLAKPVVEEEESFDLTGVGIPVGTPFYMSPEQAVAGKVDYRADMFALGATVYELMSNTKTYMGKTQAMIYGKKIKQEYKCLTKFGFKANISELIDKLLEPTVADRYETWDELIYDIRLVRKGQPISKSQNIPDTFDP